MYNQLTIFIVLATLLIEIWIVFYTFHTWRVFRKPFVKWLLIYSLTRVFFAAHGYVWRYINANLIPDILDNLDPRYESINDLFFSLVALASMILLFRIVLGLGERDFNRPARWLINTLAVVIVAGYGARVFAPWGMIVFGWLDTVAIYVTTRIAFYEFIPAALALYLGYRETDEEKAYLLKGFGWVFMLGQVLRWFPVPLHEMGASGIPFKVMSITAVLIAALTPYVWLRFVFVSRASKERRPLADEDIFQAIFSKYNISSRESEVIRLILDGKSNKEIQASLFVSIHTVKNHIYNIYKKLGVNSRYSLIHFITRYHDQV